MFTDFACPQFGGGQMKLQSDRSFFSLSSEIDPTNTQIKQAKAKLNTEQVGDTLKEGWNIHRLGNEIQVSR